MVTIGLRPKGFVLLIVALCYKSSPYLPLTLLLEVMSNEV